MYGIHIAYKYVFFKKKSGFFLVFFYMYDIFRQITYIRFFMKKDRIYKQIKQDIISGNLREGDKLPKEIECMEIYQVSRDTVRGAFKLLENEGYILRLQDHHPAFNEAKSVGAVGIPCFVLEDGTVTLSPEDAGLRSCPINEGATCNIDGSGC